jgi:hypothetical protein
MQAGTQVLAQRGERCFERNAFHRQRYGNLFEWIVTAVDKK